MKVFPVQTLILALIPLLLPGCDLSTVKPVTLHRVTVTTLRIQTVTHTQKYFCQLLSHHHFEIRALETGYIEAINVKENQTVKLDDLMLQVNYQKPSDTRVETKSNADSAGVAVGSTAVKAPFDGVVDHLFCEPKGLFKKDDILMTLSDDSLMWARFDVPEARYLEYMANRQQHQDEPKIELALLNGRKFDQVGKIGAIEADNSSHKGKIPFRADFPNPDHLLRHGQVGDVLISRVLNDVIVIPQQAVLFIDEKRYVYVVDKNDVARKTEIVIESELQDEFVVKSGVGVGDRIVVKSFPRIRDGVKVEYADHPPEKASAN